MSQPSKSIAKYFQQKTSNCLSPRTLWIEMKILFVPPIGLKIVADYKSEYQMGAIEQQIFGLAKALSSKGHRTFILRGWNSSKETEIISGVNFINVNVPFTQRGFKEKISLSTLPITYIEHLLSSIKAHRKIKALNPDIINTSTLASYYFFSKLSIPNSRKVFIAHSHDLLFTGGVISCVKRKIVKSIVSNSDAVVVLTDGMKNYLNDRGFKVDYVIPNALNLCDYSDGGDDGFILHAGRLVPHKRMEDLIKAYSEISDDIKEDLVIIGSGPCEKALKTYAASLGVKDRVIFIPFLPRSKYRDYLSKCSIFVLPSEAEAFGVVIIEAMASGKTVIARNIIGPRDIIDHGYNGFLFNDNKELKEYTTMLLSDISLRKKIGDNARKTVEKKYTFSKIADSYEELYESLALRQRFA